jgi:hypothetical protein
LRRGDIGPPDPGGDADRAAELERAVGRAAAIAADDDERVIDACELEAFPLAFEVGDVEFFGVDEARIVGLRSRSR